MVSFEVRVGEQNWKFGANQVAQIPAPAANSVLLARVEFADDSVAEHAAITGPTLLSEVTETTAGFVVVEKLSGPLPLFLCGEEVLGAGTTSPRFCCLSWNPVPYDGYVSGPSKFNSSAGVSRNLPGQTLRMSRPGIRRKQRCKVQNECWS